MSNNKRLTPADADSVPLVSFVLEKCDGICFFHEIIYLHDYSKIMEFNDRVKSVFWSSVVKQEDI